MYTFPKTKVFINGSEIVNESQVERYVIKMLNYLLIFFVEFGINLVLLAVIMNIFLFLFADVKREAWVKNVGDPDLQCRHLHKLNGMLYLCKKAL